MSTIFEYQNRKFENDDGIYIQEFQNTIDKIAQYNKKIQRKRI